MTISMARPAWRAAAAALAVAALVSCKKKEAAPPAETSASAPTPTPAAAPLTVAGIDLGSSLGADKKITAPKTTFGRRDTIYASVATTGTAPSGVLTARWTFQTGQVVDSSAQTIAPTGPAQTEFHIAKPSGWPPGKYQIEVFLDGASAGSKDFEVTK